MSLSQHSMDHATKRALDGTKERTVSVRGRLPPSTTYIPALFLSCRAASAARNPLLRKTDANAGEAQRCFIRAIEIAREQSAKSWELRATTSLARLLRDTNRGEEARAMLAEIYGWFTEGSDTADLKDAKELLDELEK